MLVLYSRIVLLLYWYCRDHSPDSGNEEKCESKQAQNTILHDPGYSMYVQYVQYVQYVHVQYVLYWYVRSHVQY